VDKNYVCGAVGSLSSWNQRIFWSLGALSTLSYLKTFR